MFEIAAVNEPSVFEPLKFYCNRCFNHFAMAILAKLCTQPSFAKIRYPPIFTYLRLETDNELKFTECYQQPAYQNT